MNYAVCIYFIDLTKAYDTIDRTLLWILLARFSVPQNMTSAICQFRDGMRACVRHDDGVCSRWFAVKQSLRQGCELALLRFKISFAVVINVTRSTVDKAIMDALVHLWGKNGAGGRGKGGNRRRAGYGDIAVGHIYADDTGILATT